MEQPVKMERALDALATGEGAGFKADREAILRHYVQNQQENGLAIKILSIFGGLLATLAFAGFLGYLGLLESGSSQLGLAVPLLILSLWIPRMSKTLVLDSLGISLFLLAMALMILGMGAFHLHPNTIALLVALLALGSLVASKNPVLNFISILTFAGALWFLVLDSENPYLAHGFVILHTLALAHGMLREATYLATRPLLCRLYGPLRIGSIFSLMFGLAFLWGLDPKGPDHPWISALPALALILGTVPSISQTLGTAPRYRNLTYILASLALLPLLFAPALAISLLLVLLAFKIQYGTGLVLGIIALCCFVLLFYYHLSLDLLTKSLLLIASGLLFLACHLLFTKRTKAHEKV